MQNGVCVSAQECLLRHYGRVLSEEALPLDFRGPALGRFCSASIRSRGGFIGEG